MVLIQSRLTYGSRCESTRSTDVHACTRCGRLRTVKSSEATPLCRDCFLADPHVWDTSRHEVDQ